MCVCVHVLLNYLLGEEGRGSYTMAFYSFRIHQSILVSESEILNIIKLVSSYIFLRDKQIDLLIRLCLPSQYLLILTYKC